MSGTHIKQWQQIIGVTVDGDFGPETLGRSKMIYKKAYPDEPIDPESKTPWMDVAREELGVEEWQGDENPRIIEYHSATTLKATEDEVPWCSSFVCWCLENAGYDHTGSAWAMSYAKYGTKLASPKIGAIVVFKWSETSGHVGFVTDFTDNTVKVLGGNQSNEVCVATFNRRSVIAWRWPVK